MVRWKVHYDKSLTSSEDEHEILNNLKSELEFTQQNLINN